MLMSAIKPKRCCLKMKSISVRESLADKFTPGEEIEVTVLSVDDQDGKIVVSHKRLAKEKRWAELEQACAEGTTLEGKVKQVVPKGMRL